MKQTFSKEIREDIYKMTHGFCQNPECLNEGKEYHHRLPNFQRYWKRYSLFLQSVFNCKFLCRDCHKNKAHLFQINERQADVYEKYLRRLQNERYIK